MSPSRRDILKLAAGGAVVLTALPHVAAQAHSEFEELIAIRDAVQQIRDGRDVQERIWASLDAVLLNLNGSIMLMCPHDPATYRTTPSLVEPDKYWWEHCPTCGGLRLSSSQRVTGIREGRLITQSA